MNNRLFCFAVIAISLCFSASLAWAGLMEKSGQRIEIVNKEDKKARAHVEVSIKENALDKGIYELRIHGKGDYAGFKDVVWVSESQIKEDMDHAVVLESSTKVFSENRVIFQSTKKYDYTSKIVTLELIQENKRFNVRKEFPIRGPICDDVTMVYVFNKIAPSTNGKIIPRFYLLTDESKLYHVMVKQRADEVLHYPSGQRETEKFQLMADLGPLTEPASKIVPPTYVWFSKEDARHWIQYEGMETGYETANIVAYKVDDTL